MATYLLAWELGAGTGHCVNLLPIAEGLISAGHQVCFAARDLAVARRVFQELPVTYLQAPYLTSSSIKIVRRPETFAQILHNTGFGEFKTLQTLASAWQHLLELTKSTAVICEHAPIALFASRFCDVQRFVIGTGFFSPPDKSPLPNVNTESPETPGSEAVDCELAITERVNRLLEAKQKQPIRYLAQLYAQVEANFLLTLPELDHYPQRVGGEYFRGWSPAGGTTPEWPSTKGPKVFAYLQPATKTWRLADFLSLLVEMNLSTVLYIPGGDQAWLEKFSNENLKFVHQRVDIKHVAEQCDLAILNGNAGTVTELLLAGIPQFLIPMHLEQATSSYQVVRLGAGLMARPNSPGQQAVQLMKLLSNSKYRERAEAFMNRYSQQESPSYLQKILQHLVPS